MKRVAKKTVAKKFKRTRANYIRLIVGVLVIGSFIGTLVSQQIRISSIRRETEQCKKQTAAKNEEYEKLSKKAEYSASDDFYEKKARDEGYVRSDETVFVIGN